jgi:hypothetical protein
MRLLIERHGYAIQGSSMDAAAFVDDDGRIELRYRVNSTPIGRFAQRQVEETLRVLTAEAEQILAQRSTPKEGSAP